jgi:hypothetical protein
MSSFVTKMMVSHFAGMKNNLEGLKLKNDAFAYLVDLKKKKGGI